MPLVHISSLEGKPTGFDPPVEKINYRTVVDTINVPPRDNFQVI